MNPLISRYTKIVDLGPCVVGRNLNLIVIRGYAPLNVLADLSAPDVYDSVKNPQGTQRDLTASKSRDALRYAIEAEIVSNSSDPRAFPEVILNARDVNVFRFKDNNDELIELDFNSFDDMDLRVSEIRSLSIATEVIEWPKRIINPQISRVDGNHRLANAETDLENLEEQEDLPHVPFAMFIGLTAFQERKIFSDINKNQKGMESGFLDVIKIDSSDEIDLIKNPKDRALWMAKQLSMDGMAFEGKVFTGGSKQGVKEMYGEVPPVKINALKRAIAYTLNDAKKLNAQFFPEPNSGEDSDSNSYLNTLLEGAKDWVDLLNRYWNAVKHAYPEAWQNRKDFILLQSIGLEGFSYLAADIIQERFLENQFSQEDFNALLENYAQNFKLDRSLFEGIAGAGGGKKVYGDALRAMEQKDPQVTVLRKKIRYSPDKSILDE